MDYMNEIFERATLSQIRNFLIYGEECERIDNTAYEEREKTVWNLIEKKLEKLCPEQEEYDKMASDIMEYACVNQDIYMELGLQCGAILAVQLLSGYKTV